MGCLPRHQALSITTPAVFACAIAVFAAVAGAESAVVENKGLAAAEPHFIHQHQHQHKEHQRQAGSHRGAAAAAALEAKGPGFHLHSRGASLQQQETEAGEEAGTAAAQAAAAETAAAALERVPSTTAAAAGGGDGALGYRHAEPTPAPTPSRRFRSLFGRINTSFAPGANSGMTGNYPPQNNGGTVLADENAELDEQEGEAKLPMVMMGPPPAAGVPTGSPNRPPPAKPTAAAPAALAPGQLLVLRPTPAVAAAAGGSGNGLPKSPSCPPTPAVPVRQPPPSPLSVTAGPAAIAAPPAGDPQGVILVLYPTQVPLPSPAPAPVSPVAPAALLPPPSPPPRTGAAASPPASPASPSPPPAATFTMNLTETYMSSKPPPPYTFTVPSQTPTPPLPSPMLPPAPDVTTTSDSSDGDVTTTVTTETTPPQVETIKTVVTKVTTTTTITTTRVERRNGTLSDQKRSPPPPPLPLRPPPPPSEEPEEILPPEPEESELPHGPGTLNPTSPPPPTTATSSPAPNTPVALQNSTAPPAPEFITFRVPQPGKKLLKLGCMVPLTGPSSGEGPQLMKAYEMAIAEKAQQELGGQVSVTMACVDTQCTDIGAYSGINKLINLGVGVILGDVCSGASIAARQVAQDKGVVMISPASTSPDLSIAGDVFYRTVPSDKYQGVALAKLIRDQGGKRTFLVQEDSAYGNGLVYSFTAAYTADNGTIAGKYTFKRGNGNVTEAMAKLQGSKADDAFLAGNDNLFLADFIVAVTAAKVPVQLFGGDSVMSPQVYAAMGADAGSASKAIIGTQTALASSAFRTRFEEFGKLEAGTKSAQGYDAVWAYFKAYAAAKNSTSQAVLAELAKTKFQGESGPIEFDQFGDLRYTPKSYSVVGFGRKGDLVPLDP